MDDDDDTPGTGSARAWFQALLRQGGTDLPAEIGPGVPARPGSGIGLGTAPPWLAPWLGDRPLSPAEEIVLQVRDAAEKCRRIGDDGIAAALLEAIALKRGRGRPPEWTDAQILNLAVDIGEVLRANPRLTGTRAIAIVAGLPQWRGWAASTLRSRFTDRFAAYNDLTFDQAIEVLRGSPRSAD
jgi:hypothetical protein